MLQLFEVQPNQTMLSDKYPWFLLQTIIEEAYSENMILDLYGQRWIQGVGRGLGTP